MEYFNAKSARNLSKGSKLDFIMLSIKEACEYGHKEIIVDDFNDEIISDKLHDLGYNLEYFIENTDSSISKKEFDRQYEKFLLSRERACDTPANFRKRCKIIW